jgi:hypothetical protein
LPATSTLVTGCWQLTSRGPWGRSVALLAEFESGELVGWLTGKDVTEKNGNLQMLSNGVSHGSLGEGEPLEHGELRLVVGDLSLPNRQGASDGPRLRAALDLSRALSATLSLVTVDSLNRRVPPARLPAWLEPGPEAVSSRDRCR